MDSSQSIYEDHARLADMKISIRFWDNWEQNF